MSGRTGLLILRLLIDLRPNSRAQRRGSRQSGGCQEKRQRSTHYFRQQLFQNVPVKSCRCPSGVTVPAITVLLMFLVYSRSECLGQSEDGPWRVARKEG